MALSLRSFSTIVSNSVTAAQGACASLLDLGIGSAGRALLESVSGVGLWLQYVALQINTRIYLTTSQGADIDTWVGQFGMTRLNGVAATGQATFTSFTPDQQSATIPVGALIKTGATVIYAVTEDTANQWWSTTAGAYVRPAGTQSITVPIQCQTIGATGNVSAGAICLLGTAIPGIDSVTNNDAVVNGSDGETDSDLIDRFPLWLESTATACVAAIENAIIGTRANLTYSLLDGEAADQTTRAGYFTAIIDDGTGDVPDELISQVYSNIDAVRACGVGFGVVRSIRFEVTVSMTVTVPAHSDLALIQSAIQTAITSDIDACSVGQGYAYARLAVVAWNNSPVTPISINDVLLNGAQADIPSNTAHAVRAGTITITVVDA